LQVLIFFKWVVFVQYVLVRTLSNCNLG